MAAASPLQIRFLDIPDTASAILMPAPDAV